MLTRAGIPLFGLRDLVTNGSIVSWGMWLILQLDHVITKILTDGKYPFFVRSDKVERLNEYDFDTKAILVPGDGRIGEIFHYYNGKFALHQRVYKVDNFNGINELFLLGLFKYSFKEHALRLNAQGTVPSLRLPMFTNWSISVPMITEQERIGVFFQKLDRTISLYDHKLELLKKVKRSMLQAMFI
ncbi:hypothetical protein LI610_00220 (plasmid) [Lactobacillus delbrueckii subsp. indicus]|uniref:restriction endonuclease subunit S n=1 Tax=Lactobacillus delbrueckii TaxID=1584 RepID=UPI0009382517|nr:restriction endonuclease subunit S [Lactobacillus delbrueckii]APP02159.1 hypothetical protein LI610_00220 [Lactobacillus delbrueckii subsp. indicus]